MNEKIYSSRVRLSKYATNDDDEIANKRNSYLEFDGFRSQFERDYTRILHSRSFRRMRHKTQVFIRPENDHLCTRLEHSLYVASIAKTIAKKLSLNIELVLAISLGHDLGHSPFGHEGEDCLNEIGYPCGIRFKHELHSLRVIDELDSPYPKHKGLNLTFAVRDGIVCHNGEKFERILKPKRDKSSDELCQMTELGPLPATMEGCVVRFADKIAYLGRDLEDARTIRIITDTEIPAIIKNKLGLKNRDIINVLIRDLVENSEEKDFLCFSEDVFEAFTSCKDFNHSKIYKHDVVINSFPKIREAMKAIFDKFTDIIKQGQEYGQIDFLNEKHQPHCYEVLAIFLKEDIRDWAQQLPERLSIDFIAGMTDNFFIETFKELFLPRSIV